MIHINCDGVNGVTHTCHSLKPRGPSFQRGWVDLVLLRQLQQPHFATYKAGIQSAVLLKNWKGLGPRPTQPLWLFAGATNA